MKASRLKKAGLKMNLKEHNEYLPPDEQTAALNNSPDFQKAIMALSPGRQRRCIFHFFSAKRLETRIARIAKNNSRILKGRGLTDQ